MEQNFDINNMPGGVTTRTNYSISDNTLKKSIDQTKYEERLDKLERDINLDKQYHRRDKSKIFSIHVFQMMKLRTR